MLTIFTCPKPFNDLHIRMIQRNALHSWMQLRPQPEILLLGDESGAGEIAREFELKHIPDVGRNAHGTPLVPSLWSLAERSASNDVCAYVNADIILDQDFARAVERVTRLKKFLMLGQRTDCKVTELLELSDESTAGGVLEEIIKAGELRGPTGIDYFVFRRGLWREMPELALGRCAWDQWLVAAAWQEGTDIVDATNEVLAIHQDHHYVNNTYRTADDVWTSKEAEANRSLAGEAQFTVHDANYLLNRHGMVFARDRDHVMCRMDRVRNCFPGSPLVRSWKFLYAICWLGVFADRWAARRRAGERWAFKGLDGKRRSGMTEAGKQG